MVEQERVRLMNCCRDGQGSRCRLQHGVTLNASMQLESARKPSLTVTMAKSLQLNRKQGVRSTDGDQVTGSARVGLLSMPKPEPKAPGLYGMGSSVPLYARWNSAAIELLALLPTTAET